MKQFVVLVAFTLPTQSNFPGVVAEITPARLPPINPTQCEEEGEEREESRGEEIQYLSHRRFDFTEIRRRRRLLIVSKGPKLPFLVRGVKGAACRV